MKKLLITIMSLFLGITVVFGLTSCNNNSNDKLVGFDIDLAREVAKELGVKVVFQEIQWEQKEVELNGKSIDLIWNGLTITEERQAAMNISNAYMANKQVVIGKKDNGKTITATSTYKIAVEAGSAGSDVIDDNELFANTQKVEVGAQIDALTEVLSGTSDFAIIDSVMAGYYLASSTSYSSLKIYTEYEFEAEYYGIAARKADNALMQNIEAALYKIYNAGTTNTIAAKYGLTDVIVAPNAVSVTATDDSFEYIKKKGTLVIGYTLFAPIAFEA